MTLVDRFKGDQAMMIECTSCKATGKITPEDLNQEARWPCPKDCGGEAEFKFFEAERCRGCEKLGFWEEALGFCCSRRCMLQVEYKNSLPDRCTCGPGERDESCPFHSPGSMA